MTPRRTPSRPRAPHRVGRTVAILGLAGLALAASPAALAQPAPASSAIPPPASAPLPSGPAAPIPAPHEGDFVLRDVRLHDGSVLPELRQHYVTLGDPSGEPVLVLHGTGGSGAGMLTPDFAGRLFGPGQPLDARTHYVILPDALGAGRSSKPSDGLGPRFPAYTYDDMVEAQHRLLTEGLGVRHLRLVIGLSMGGMECWLWGITHPGFSDALVPMASQPAAMSGRNWLLRHMLVEAIRRDPGFDGGNYRTEPASLQLAATFYGLATSGGTLHDQAAYPDAASGSRYVDSLLDRRATFDANDFIAQWNASRDYDPSGRLDRITDAVLAINSADDERNPPETGTMTRGMSQLRHGTLFLVPASPETRGHATLGDARFFADRLAAFLRTVPHDGESP